jgi:alcohol dehydrogenase, propanol-preferring
MAEMMKAAVVHEFGRPLTIMVLNGITLRGSIVGTRLDLQEALDLAGEGAVRATVQTARLEDVNDVFERLHAGQIEGRVVLDLGR